MNPVIARIYAMNLTEEEHKTALDIEIMVCDNGNCLFQLGDDGALRSFATSGTVLSCVKLKNEYIMNTASHDGYDNDPIAHAYLRETW